MHMYLKSVNDIEYSDIFGLVRKCLNSIGSQYITIKIDIFNLTIMSKSDVGILNVTNNPQRMYTHEVKRIPLLRNDVRVL